MANKKVSIRYYSRLSFQPERRATRPAPKAGFQSAITRVSHSNVFTMFALAYLFTWVSIRYYSRLSFQHAGRRNPEQ